MLRIEKRCFNCNKKFIAHRSYTKYCSKKCRDKDNYPKQELEQRKCKHCNAIYMPNRSNQKYCSKICAKIKMQEWQENMKKTTDFRIFERDDFTCIYCGKSSIIDNIKLAVDHVYPRIKGGKNDLFNLVTTCEKCNSSKNSKVLKKEIILIIAERNNNLNSCFSTADYTNLVSRFNKKYK